MIAQRVRIIKTGETGTVSRVEEVRANGFLPVPIYTITLDKCGEQGQVVETICFRDEFELIGLMDAFTRSLVEALGLICATFAITGELERQIAERKKQAGLN